MTYVPNKPLRAELDCRGIRYDEDDSTIFTGMYSQDAHLDWMCASYSESNNQLTLSGLTPEQAADAIEAAHYAEPQCRRWSHIRHNGFNTSRLVQPEDMECEACGWSREYFFWYEATGYYNREIRYCPKCGAYILGAVDADGRRIQEGRP